MTTLTGKIYDIQGFSVQDGPGVRTTVFLKGCPLRCPWCHSPESQRFSTELNWMSIRCLGIEVCGWCLGVCPNDCIVRGEEKLDATGKSIVLPSVDKSNCSDCGQCAKACKATALYMCGEDKSVDEVLYRLVRDKPFFEESGGGVTVSGGECLCQPDFTVELLKRCKEENIGTAVDTTGYVNWDIVERTLPFTDMYLYDLKCMDSQKHKQVVGVPNELILTNATKIAGANGKLWIRIPVMPMFNDSEDDFKKYGDFLSTIKDSVINIQLLPYHKYGLSKYDRLLSKQSVFEATPPSDEFMELRKNQLVELGFEVQVH